MSEGRFGRFLRRSFDALEREVPDIHAEMCRRLAPRAVRLEVDGEVVPIRFDSSTARFEAAATAAIEVRTSRTAILALVGGDCSLTQAVLDDALLLRGEADELLAFHDGLMAYLHGAIRAPSFPALLRQYRALPTPEPVSRAKRKEAA